MKTNEIKFNTKGILKVSRFTFMEGHKVYVYLFQNQKEMNKYVESLKHLINEVEIKNITEDNLVGAVTLSWELNENKRLSYIFFYKSQFSTRLIAHEATHSVYDYLCWWNTKIDSEDLATLVGELTDRIRRSFKEYVKR